MTQLFPVRTQTEVRPQTEVRRDALAAQAVVEMSAVLQEGLRPGLYQELVTLEASMGHDFRHGFRLADLDRAQDDGMEGPI